MARSVHYVMQEQGVQTKTAPQKWQRILLLAVLGYEAAGCLLGGILLIAAPDGRLMDMPTSMMHGVFSDFLIPGILLSGLGILNSFAFIAVIRKTKSSWLLASLAMGGLIIWFWVEIAILQELHWLHAMWGLPVIIGALAIRPSSPSIVRKALLACGIIASLLYVVINIIVPMQWLAYDPASQTVSELSAVGAPTRILWIILSAPYTILMIAFALGILRSAAENRRMRITGILLVFYGAMGVLWPFAPMHLRETLATGGGTISDTLHITLGVVTELLFLSALILAATALGKKFRLFSFATLAALLVFGVLTFLDAPGIAANQPTPLIGVWERINIGVFLLWVIVLAIVLFPERKQVF